MQKATVKQVSVLKGKRIIVISDIHGHLQNFQNLLKKVGFSKEDILVIDGDVLEKGPQSLATLRYVMQLAKEYTVYQVLGNNDWLWDELETEDNQANEDLLGYMLSRNSIYNEMSFSRWCIVGHFPTCLYDKEKIDCAVLIDRKRKLISIDGGCVVKNSGQLNALIIPEGGSEEFTWDCVDDLPKAVAVQAQSASEQAHSIHWPDNVVQVIKQEGDLSLCRAENSGIEMWIPSSLLVEWRGKMYTDETTDYQLEIDAGDEVSVVARTSRGALVKKNGLLAWYFGTLEDITENK